MKMDYLMEEGHQQCQEVIGLKENSYMVRNFEFLLLMSKFCCVSFGWSIRTILFENRFWSSIYAAFLHFSLFHAMG